MRLLFSIRIPVRILMEVRLHRDAEPLRSVIGVVTAPSGAPGPVAQICVSISTSFTDVV